MPSLIRRVRRHARVAVHGANVARDRLLWQRRFGQVEHDLDRRKHIAEAAEWLKRAQDAGTDRGVSYGATLGEGWRESYPETTGYIICTFLDLADFYGDRKYEKRAVEMGDWEIEIQLDSGAVMGSRVNSNPTPAVFNTGQVLLGWSALFRRTGERRFLDAARRAVEWMLSVQEEDGNWIKGNSRYAHARATVYNVKAAWGLLEAGTAGGWDDAAAGALANAEYCLTRQSDNGWFADCCLKDAESPLLHTIAYTMQGLVGIGRLAEKPRYIEAAEKTARSLRALMDVSGFLPGRIDAGFRGAVDWCCLTGTAQASIVWSDLYDLTGNPDYLEAAQRANRYLMARHNVSDEDPMFRGAVFGSWPFWGDYGRNRVLNWATKFFVDALLREERRFSGNKAS